ncbi:MAG: hypothetical protein M1817_005219 [Caeruleum heppii]|nr:MAG: hypothetical protein M1817_005219 [Caeruleum heppii]
MSSTPPPPQARPTSPILPLTALHETVACLMSPRDASHAYSHAVRVQKLALRIAAAERRLTPSVHYDDTLIALAALTHDLEDHKYPLPDGSAPVGIIEKVLQDHDVPEELRIAVRDICACVSYTTELASPENIQDTLIRHPELGPVQDADRLDALGAIGIGRVFTFGAAHRSEEGFESVMRHFETKLVGLEDRMKTRTGREMARGRTERLSVFEGWWGEEMVEAGGEWGGVVRVVMDDLGGTIRESDGNTA